MTLLRRFAAVMFGLVGLVFVLIGTVQLKNQTWQSATGTVQTCTVTSSHSGATSRTRNVYTCVVTWEAGGQARTHRLEVPASVATPGCPVDLRVNGDAAALATPVWRAALPAVIGVVMVVGAGFLFFRARRRTVVRGSVAVRG